MNKQSPGIEWTHAYGRPGYTLTLLGGCIHECKWKMPDGDIAICYAKEIAQGVASAAYPQGFEHLYWHPERLKEPGRVKTPSGIFIDAMADMFAHNVEAEQIEAVLEMVRDNPQHIFFVLTKNAPRLLKFKDLLPLNLWTGVSMPPSFMFGKELSRSQQVQYVHRAMDVLEELKAPGRVRWMSFEPLSFPVDVTLNLWAVWNSFARRPLPLEWSVIGAASKGKVKYQPNADWVSALLRTLGKDNIPVFFKGNLRGNLAADPWREEYPAQVEPAVEHK